jgi:hypothetical protein
LSILNARIFENITQWPDFRQFEVGKHWTLESLGYLSEPTSGGR